MDGTDSGLNTHSMDNVLLLYGDGWDRLRASTHTAWTMCYFSMEIVWGTAKQHFKTTVIRDHLS